MLRSLSFPEETDKRESLAQSPLPFLHIGIWRSLFWECRGSHVLKWAGVTEMDPDAVCPFHF